jgi:hypothetical protein
VHGEPGEPAHGAPPTDTAQIGHGCVGLPVRMVFELRGKLHVAAPVAVSMVPVGNAENVFVTHRESPAFEIGSGTPNGHPTQVQSTPGGVEPGTAPVMPHVVPMHFVRLKRFVAPAGTTLSGTCELPPPIEIRPQRRFFSGIVSARSRYVLPQVPMVALDVKSKRACDSSVVDVVVVAFGSSDVEELVDVVLVDEVVGAPVVLVVVASVDVVDVDVEVIDPQNRSPWLPPTARSTRNAHVSPSG